MHGTIFLQLKKYVCEKFGDEKWDVLLEKSNLEKKIYLPVKEYPDEDALSIVSTASKITGLATRAILEDFGEFIVPGLLEMYGSLVQPEWNALDLIERTEETIHKVVIRKNPGAKPPHIKSNRISPKEIAITYDSPRKMCALAKGIINGIAKHYETEVEIIETSCMLRGSPSCNISITLKD